MQDAQARVMDLIFGRWRSQILHAGVTLGMFDALADGSRNAAAVAGQLGLDPALSYRLLRALGSLELLREDDDRRFSLTDAGNLLRKDNLPTLRGITLLEEGPVHYALWKHLPAMVRDGKQNGFMREFGRMAFEHAAKDPEYGRVFNEAMNSYTSAQTAWVLDALDAYDFSGITHLADIGGGHGQMLCHLLARHPGLRGTVLELASVIADEKLHAAKALKVADRCAYVPGDMFTAAPPADAYLLKLILHDWNDDECVRILRNIHTASAPKSRVFIIEHILPGPRTPHFAKLFDIHMMCWGTGRERTVEEYTALLEKAGFQYVRTWPTKAGLIGIIEAVKTQA